MPATISIPGTADPKLVAAAATLKAAGYDTPDIPSEQVIGTFDDGKAIVGAWITRFIDPNITWTTLAEGITLTGTQVNVLYKMIKLVLDLDKEEDRPLRHALAARLFGVYTTSNTFYRTLGGTKNVLGTLPVDQSLVFKAF